MRIIPDLNTLRPVPWVENGVKVAEMLCESRWKTDNAPQEACPRYVARQQLQRLGELGLKLYSGFEIEFTLLEKKSLKSVNEFNDVYRQSNFAKHSNYFFGFDRNFFESKIDIERFHCELGPGQFEVVMKPKYGIECPDMTLNLKEGLIETANQKDLVVSFMTDSQTTNTSHFNFSLWSETGENMFYDASSPDNLSVTAKQWIAGILKHGKALTAFANPTINCFRRIGVEMCPSVISWGIEDRDGCLRIKNEGPFKTYMEYRPPSGKINPYLVMASIIAAGLDGVINKMECPPPGITGSSETLPNSLSEALEELEEDVGLVNALGQELVTWFVKCKRVGEIAKFEGLQNDGEAFAMERQLYF
ncbi:lengsin-like [Haliotis rufescens]|uniref:lengsin-like n=1 Tax=Haliotis rufescens TaxID=6454 RepID=UPI00201EECBC|nr:lengsin-like [Haliotis rufescens]